MNRNLDKDTYDLIRTMHEALAMAYGHIEASDKGTFTNFFVRSALSEHGEYWNKKDESNAE